MAKTGFARLRRLLEADTSNLGPNPEVPIEDKDEALPAISDDMRGIADDLADAIVVAISDATGPGAVNPNNVDDTDNQLNLLDQENPEGPPPPQQQEEDPTDNDAQVPIQQGDSNGNVEQVPQDDTARIDDLEQDVEALKAKLLGGDEPSAPPQQEENNSPPPPPPQANNDDDDDEKKNESLFRKVINIRTIPIFEEDSEFDKEIPVTEDSEFDKEMPVCEDDDFDMLKDLDKELGVDFSEYEVPDDEMTEDEETPKVDDELVVESDDDDSSAGNLGDAGTGEPSGSEFGIDVE